MRPTTCHFRTWYAKNNPTISRLIHFTDGKVGTIERLKVAQMFSKDFGVATECGFGRRDPHTILELLHLHAEIADLAI